MLRHCLISQTFGVLALTGSLALASCGSSSADSRPLPSSGTSGGSAGAPFEAPTLRFFLDEAPDVSLVEQELIPEESRLIGVQATPPDAYRVRFSLVSLEGAPPHDGSLDRTDALTDPTTGTAHVMLRAPSSFTQFTLQASIGTTSTADLKVDVQSQGWAELQVIPEYNGQRQVTEWVANAYLKVRCPDVAQVTDLDRGLPADTQYNAKSVFGIPPRLEVPVQPNMAITMRAGHYLFGCINLDQPLINELNSVTVNLANVPIQMNDVSLDIQLGVQESTEAWIDHLETAAEDAVLAFTGDTENDLELLLETMASLLDSASEREDFQAAAAADDWETRALPSVAGMETRALRNALAGWLSAGSTAISAETAFTGTLQSPPAADGTAEIHLDEVAGVDAERAGFEPTVSATWSADPNDTVALGATLRWSTSALVSALGEAKATLEHPEADDLSEAFAGLVDCQVLAETLAGDATPFVFAECDAACTAALCRDALDALEVRLWAASDEEQQLQLSATGVALVDDEARAVAFTGTWRGTFPMGESSAVGGAISGTKTQEASE